MPGDMSTPTHYHYEAYRKYLHTSAWKKKRKQALTRAGHRCESCASGASLTVHHLTYDNLYREPLEDLQVLCRPCHERVHGLHLPKKRRAKFGMRGVTTYQVGSERDVRFRERFAEATTLRGSRLPHAFR